MGQWDFSKSEFDAILALYITQLRRQATADPSPCAYLTGGQSGAGKSAFQYSPEAGLQQPCIVLDADTYRSLHPHYFAIQKKHGKEAVRQTQDFAAQFVEALIDRLSADNYNLLIEGTLRTADVPRETASKLREKGYRTELLMMITKPEISLLSTILRYEKLLTIEPALARPTPKSHHNLIVAHLCDNLSVLYSERIFDNIRLYDRSMRLLYSQSETPDTNPASVTENALFGSWSEEELVLARRTVEEIASLMDARGVKNSADRKTVAQVIKSIPGF
ncbi:MAG: zeta toxin family protein [Clostridiales Family XIII bacterium]|jgi:UDP-N-acetylglucosamine kinase|nr:zeta toxin family protein [Clostridiales Family XIII bacterium]